MTDKIRQSLGLLVVAFIAALIGFAIGGTVGGVEGEQIGGLIVLVGFLIGLYALVQIARDLLRNPQRD